MKIQELYEANEKCKMCTSPATKKLLWADGRAYIPVCDHHYDDGQAIIAKREGHKAEKVIPIAESKDTMMTVENVVTDYRSWAKDKNHDPQARTTLMKYVREKGLNPNVKAKLEKEINVGQKK